MHPTVRVVQPNRSQLYLVISEPLALGRECDGLLLADDKVSRRHLQLAPRDGAIVVSDLGSTNGSFINGQRIDVDTLLVAGATLTLGDTIVTLEAPPPPASAASQTTRQDVGGTIVATLPPTEQPRVHTPGPTNERPAMPAPPSTTTPPVTPAMPGIPAGARTSDEPLVRPRSAADDTRRTSMDEIAASLGGQKINLPSGSADDTVTIMFSDIESSTELALSMGDHRWYEILTWHNQLIEQRVAAHGGFIVKNQGDGFMVTFNSARRAIICASEIQQALHQHAVADPASAVRVRIGLHTGEAIRQDSGDLFGRHVIIAARVGGLANGAEILVSSIVREIASARGDLHFGDGALVELKGVGEQTVYPVLWGTALPQA